ncbi:MAG: LptF/LptG family permease [Chlamydiia bacterium]|nr:LptF/LptG family permease [Chlamydiia bacterium]
MPILWKFLLGRFLRVLILCSMSFISVMLVMRLSDIAKFATQSSEASTVLLFMLYQVPYILPIAIPISCLVAAMTTMRNLSDDNELTALRSGGLSLYSISAPILVLSLFLVLLNFYIASELTPYCRNRARELMHRTTAENPRYLLQKSKYLRFPDVEADMEVIQPKSHAKDLMFVMYNRKLERLCAVMAKDVRLSGGLLKGKDVALLTSMPSKDGFDHLVIENESKTTLPSADLALLLRRPSMKTTYDSLPYRSMRLKAEQEAHRSKTKRRLYFEMIRRASYGLAPFSFTAVGLSFGIQIGRRQRRRALYLAAGLAALMLTSTLIGKSFEAYPLYAALCYFLPHPIAWMLSFRYKKQKERGVE